MVTPSVSNPVLSACVGASWELLLTLAFDRNTAVGNFRTAANRPWTALAPLARTPQASQMSTLEPLTGPWTQVQVSYREAAWRCCETACGDFPDIVTAGRGCHESDCVRTVLNECAGLCNSRSPRLQRETRWPSVAWTTAPGREFKLEEDGAHNATLGADRSTMQPSPSFTNHLLCRHVSHAPRAARGHGPHLQGDRRTAGPERACQGPAATDFIVYADARPRLLSRVAWRPISARAGGARPLLCALRVRFPLGPPPSPHRGGVSRPAVHCSAQSGRSRGVVYSHVRGAVPRGLVKPKPPSSLIVRVLPSRRVVMPFIATRTTAPKKVRRRKWGCVGMHRSPPPAQTQTGGGYLLLYPSTAHRRSQRTTLRS
jgi:hypothetical protein